MMDKSGEPFPYFATAAELPQNLRKHILHDGPADWLVLPDEGVGREATGTFAFRVDGNDLEFVTEQAFNGQYRHGLAAADCDRISFTNCLLCSEVLFFKGASELFRFSYSSVGDALVRRVLQPFCEGVCDSRAISFALPANTICKGGSAVLLDQFFPAGEPYAIVGQSNDVVRKTGGFLRRKLQIIPAAAVAISRTRLVISTTSAGSCSWLSTKQLTVLPLSAVDSAQVITAKDQSVSVHFALAAGGELAVRFDAAENPAILTELKDVVSIFASAAVISSISAQHELLRLTGVNLPEADALQALAEIHNFKWLEAERAGFDTWAIIQPENPLRAAAVHWVRKHFNKFETAHAHHAVGHDLAS